jgi:flavodoxin
MRAAGWTGAAAAADGKADDASRILIVYYSHSGVTKGIAEKLQAKLGGVLHRVEPATAYPSDNDTFRAQARKEVDDGVKLELKGEMPNFENFDLVLVGGPVWFGTMAPPLSSFLAKANLEGKVVAPFWTFGGGQGNYFDTFVAAVPGGVKAMTSRARRADQTVEVWEGLGLSRAVIENEENLEKAIADWVAKLPLPEIGTPIDE